MVLILHFVSLAERMLSLFNWNSETCVYHRYNDPNGVAVVRGNGIVTENKLRQMDPASMPALFLPRSVQQDSFDVIFVGHFTDMEKDVVREKHAIDHLSLRAYTEF